MERYYRSVRIDEKLEKEKEDIKKSIEKAVAFIESIYDIEIGNKVMFQFVSRIQGSYFHPNKHHSIAFGMFGYSQPTVICARPRGRIGKWWTYKRKTIGAMARGIKVSWNLHRTLILVHELTHYVQMVEKRKYSEIETTLNEIRYVEKYHPSVAAKLSVIK